MATVTTATPPPPQLCGDAATRTAFADAFTAALAANGSYAALPGTFSFFNVTICEVLGTCFFQNANGREGEGWSALNRRRRRRAMPVLEKKKKDEESACTVAVGAEPFASLGPRAL